jgi:hypothetical protein
MAEDKIVLFWKRHRKAFVAAICIYELVLGILIWYLLNLSQQMYDLGAKDCYDWMKKMNDLYATGLPNYTINNWTLNFSGYIPTTTIK